MAEHRASDGGRIDDVLEAYGKPLMPHAKFAIRDNGQGREEDFDTDKELAYITISRFIQRVTHNREEAVYLVPMNTQEYKAYCAQRDAQQELPRDQPERITLLLQKLQEELSTGPDAREKSLRFLQNAGIMGEDGQLTPDYREQTKPAQTSG